MPSAAAAQAYGSTKVARIAMGLYGYDEELERALEAEHSALAGA